METLSKCVRSMPENDNTNALTHTYSRVHMYLHATCKSYTYVYEYIIFCVIHITTSRKTYGSCKLELFGLDLTLVSTRVTYGLSKNYCRPIHNRLKSTGLQCRWKQTECLSHYAQSIKLVAEIVRRYEFFISAFYTPS